ncbi:DNA polymerase III subunit gamma/tau [candidate division KSB1 bacterium]|nr:DNA polymerase III subunit gamma/tau [candidate division KSB1 bacterium]RQW05153.1 MAG: DNA polymerase III subunit gamma/tau [candidate division KSB1 bacterium]
MSYLVLARKYRPMFFEDVVGQEHVTKTLQNAIEQNRLANAYLFTGPRGVGKTTIARILSKAINCDHGPTTRPCNECSSCIEVNESRSLDVLEIDGASNRGIDEVRNLRESLRYSPNPGKYRVHIIDEVHMLTNEAFNALLKTLEEPPPRVLFIFATTEPHKVPATILSRCQRFDFKRITTKRIIALLTELCEKEGISIDDESLRLIATKGDGSMRDAESILDQIIAFSGTSITAEDTTNLLGIIGQELFFKVTDLIQSNDVQGGIELVQHIFSEGYDFNEFLIGLSEHLRNFMVAKSTEKTELNVAEEHAQRYMAEAHIFEIEDLLRLIKISSDAENLIRKSANARLHLEMALIRMIKLTKSVQLSELLSEVREAKKKSDVIAPPGSHGARSVRIDTSNAISETSRPFAPVTHTPPQQEFSSSGKQENVRFEAKQHEESSKSHDIDSAPFLPLEEIEKKWPTVIERVKRKKIALGSLLTEGWPTRVEGVQVELAFDDRNGFHIASVERQASVIEEIIEEVVGTRLKINCIKVEKEKLAHVRKSPARIDKKAEFEKLEREDEIVKLIVDKFDAEFIK